MVDRITNFFGDKYRDVAKGFMGVLKESRFYEEGVLTPEEFIESGDYLTQKCPTWKWCSTSSSQEVKPVDFLPENKQYLVTLSVPCPKRAREYEKINNTTENMIEDGWVETKVDMYDRDKNKSDVVDIDAENLNGGRKKQQVVENNVNIDDKYMDIDVIKEDPVPGEPDQPDIEVVNDDFIVVDEDNDINVIRTRTYDISVTYDYYYRVPRMWLTGYNEMGIPLTEEEIKEDIMMEYIDRTVTIDKHPHTGVKSVSIHPCKHSALLLRMIENYAISGKKLEVYKSIILFLKFLHSIVPTIQYDFTMDIDF